MAEMRRPLHVSPGGGRRAIRLSAARAEVLQDLYDDQVAKGGDPTGWEGRAKAAFRKLHCVRGGVYVLRETAEPTWSDRETEAAERLKALGDVAKIAIDADIHRGQAEVLRWLDDVGLEVEDGPKRAGAEWVLERASADEAELHAVELAPGMTAWTTEREAGVRTPRRRSDDTGGGGRAGKEAALKPKDADLVPGDDMSDARLAALRMERSGRFGVQVIAGEDDDGEDDSKLAFADGDPEDLADFGDPVNLAWPMAEKAQLRKAMTAFAAEDKGREEYGQRSQKIVWSRLVDRALKDGVQVDKAEPLNALLAPDMRAKVNRQDVTKEDVDPAELERLQDLAEQCQEDALQRATKAGLVEKLDLEGKTLEDWMELVHRAVAVAARAGLFGPISEHGYGVNVHTTGETHVIVNNWHNGGAPGQLWYRAKWAMKSGKVTVSDVKEVERRESWEEVGDGPMPDDSVTASADGEDDELGTALGAFAKTFDAPASADPFDGLDAALTTFGKALDDDPPADPVEAALALLERSAAEWELEPELTDETDRGVQTTKGPDGSFVRQVPIVKVDAETGEFWAEVYVPFERDTQGDWMTPDEIEKARLGYMVESQRIDASHDYVERDVSVTSCFQARPGDQDFTPGAWVQGAKAHDPVIAAAVVDGTYNMWSLAGTARAIAGSAPPGEEGAS